MEYLVREDNVAEPDEVFSINIANSVVNVNQGVMVTIIVPSVNVTIIDNDGECTLMLLLLASTNFSEFSVDIIIAINSTQQINQ